jgi:hypothetical protein
LDAIIVYFRYVAEFQTDLDQQGGIDAVRQEVKKQLNKSMQKQSLNNNSGLGASESGSD